VLLTGSGSGPDLTRTERVFAHFVDATRSDLAHLWRRVGFGATAAELDAAELAGWEATLDALLHPRGSDPGVAATPPPTSPVVDVAGKAGSDQRKRAGRTLQAQGVALADWWVSRMVAATQPFPEKLTLFWHGHFATSIQKVRQSAWMLQQNELLRTAGQSPFAGLTLAIAQGAAMMIWLDTDKDTAANPNENFARELMEIFTLGAGNYSELDVRAGARAFTGWSFDRQTGAFREVASRHDSGTKTFLGNTGDLDGTDIVRIVTARPDSARFITSRLWNSFVAPATTTTPDVVRLTPVAPLDTAALIARIFADDAFLTSKGALVAQPIEYVVGVQRQLNVTLPEHTVRQALADLGQVPFAPPNVGGWPSGTAWLTTASTLARVQFARQASASADLSAIADVPAAQRISAVARLLSQPDGFSPQTTAALETAGGDPAVLVATALISPEYVAR
jgi:uncharacterized protein (DUF1800 family)